MIFQLKKIKTFITVDIRLILRNFEEHDGELSTCALAFFALISFIPASLVIISILSFFYNSQHMANFYLEQIKSQLPSINIDKIIEILDNIIYKKRYIAFIWVPFLFWWGSLVFDIIERVLEKAFRISESRKYWKAKIRHILIILSISFLILLFVFTSNIIALLKNSQITSLIKDNLYDITIFNMLLEYIEKIPFFFTKFTAFITNMLLLFILYRFVPPKKLNNASIIKGALFATALYEAAKLIFSYYITEINDYTSIFGPLSTIVILMIWIWFTCFMFVVGAEIAWIFFEKNEKAEFLDFNG